MVAQPSSFIPEVFTDKQADADCQSYQKFAAIVNRLISRDLNRFDETTAAKYFKPTVFHTIHALHGFFNGRNLKKKGKELMTAHKFVAPFFDYHGDPENCGLFVGRRLNALRDAEFAAGHRYIELQRADDETLFFTHYKGHPLLDAAKWVYAQARRKPDYWNCPAAAVTVELLDKALDRLPKIDPEEVTLWQKKQDRKEALKSGTVEMEAGDEKLGAVLKGRWTKLKNTFSELLEEETFKGGKNPVTVFDEVAADLKKVAAALYEKKCRDLDPGQWKGTGGDWIGDADETSDREAKHGYKDPHHAEPLEESEAVVLEECTPIKNEGGQKSEVTGGVEVSESAPLDEVATLGAWALRWAAIGVPVIPLHEVYDGICSCRKGSECRTHGKHPRTKNGVDDATTDPEQIRRWWSDFPTANIGGAMGGALRWLAVDVDPRSGGDANLYSLVDAHGDEWLDTLNHKTGSGGDHFFYTIPEGVEFTKGKLAKGIDLKWTGGLVVLPPSAHLSGNSYAIKAAKPVAPAPAWLLEELTRAADVPPSVPVDLQERRERSGSFGTRRFSLGERNDGLRDVACGRWRHGFAADAQELYEQMREVRDMRCEFVAGDPPPDDKWLYDLVLRTVRKYARGDLKQEATA